MEGDVTQSAGEAGAETQGEPKDGMEGTSVE